MYPIVEPYNTGYLYVGDDHELYYEECGNPDGKPVVFLHGGPGGAFSEDSRGLFDPERYRIILYDQRGAGHSRPFASIKANTIEHLVADIEKLKLHLGIEQWMVVGGSWGSALALLYTIDYPGSVTELIVSGISLGDPEGVNWFVEEGGASRLMPDWFAPYRDFIPPEDRTYGLAKAYYNILIYGADDDERVIAAAERFDVWDTSLLRHNVRKDLIREIEAKPEQSVAFARIFYHYVLHEYKNGNKWKILDGVRHLKHIPCEIVHGRYDLICPAENAWAVHEAYPGSNLTIIQGGGHSILDPGLSDRVIEVTDAWAEGAKAKRKAKKK
ncbi:MAG: prolyl aminopeptidase [Rhodospirillales bacterium]|nr:prolyl aminopeptidase [Rhodospirillales bacterium]MCB9995527.1 prolyl aminopeptidase [Rhodospirillales bacterium]